MNNLTQKQKDAKNNYLQRQLDKTIETYQNATPEERTAAIGHIDSFMEVLQHDQKAFWLEMKERLKTMNEVRCADQDTFNTIFRGGDSSPFPSDFS